MAGVSDRALYSIQAIPQDVSSTRFASQERILLVKNPGFREIIVAGIEIALAIRSGFQSEQTAKFRQGPPCAVTPGGTRSPARQETSAKRSSDTVLLGIENMLYFLTRRRWRFSSA